MNEVSVKYRTIVFLYAYLQQMDLSLDRSRWGKLVDLRDYYKKQISPDKIIRYLFTELGLNQNKFQHLFYVAKPSVLFIIKNRFIRHFNKILLHEDDIYYCCQKLLVFEQYLSSEDDIDKLAIEKLRVEMSNFTFKVISVFLYRRDRERGGKVEHFLQSENISTISISEFLNGIEL